MVLVVAALALTGCGAEETGQATSPESSKPVKEATAPALREVRQQAGQLLDGGPDAFKARLAELRGHPVVVNQWASWCGPCRFEFPFLRDQANKHGHRVAFLGVDSKDSRSEAEEFLQKIPVPFPHYYDEDAEIARVFRGGRAWPTTAFYDAAGKLVYTHAGAYATEEKLEQDILKYAR